MFAGSAGALACVDAGPGLPHQVRAANLPVARSWSMTARMKFDAEEGSRGDFFALVVEVSDIELSGKGLF